MHIYPQMSRFPQKKDQPLETGDRGHLSLPPPTNKRPKTWFLRQYLSDRATMFPETSFFCLSPVFLFMTSIS